MPNKTPIYTIQFLDLSFKNRLHFLDFIYKNIYDVALKNQALFKLNNCDAEYFHKDKTQENKVPKLINCFIKDNVLTIRAYTKKGAKTLKLWYKIYKKIAQQNCENVRVSKEAYQFKLDEEKLHYYSSENWIAFDKVMFKNKTYFINGNEAKFQSALVGHLRTFLNDLCIDNSGKILKLELLEIPKQHKTIIGLKTTQAGKINRVSQFSFKIQFSTNYILPALFSLGRKKGYGNGVFVKDYTKTIHNENRKTNLKTTAME